MSHSYFDFERLIRQTFVAQIDFHQEIGSTNTRALEISGTAQSFPVLVLAERQTAGRGRGTNSWWTSQGSLTFSLVLQSTGYALSPSQSPLLSLAAGLAVAMAIAELVWRADVRVKWPNDVYVDGRKASGILLETSSQRPTAIALGIGINVNNSISQAPVELQAIATSLADVSGRKFDRTEVLIGVLQKLEACLKLIPHDLPQLADQWRSRCYLQGRTVQLDRGAGRNGRDRVTGVCQGIDDDGALILQTETGLVRCLSGIVVKIL